MNRKLQIVRILFFIASVLLFHTKLNATITKTIGATGDYASITAAWAAIPGIESPITQPWIFELKSDYNIASETFPINLTAISGASATNTITIRPQTGVTALTITTAAAASALKLNGADYVIIDGRPGGAGASELTIENSQTASSKFAIHLTADAIYNTIQYCTVKGSSYATTSVQNASVICIDEGNATTNCDNTTITNCTITKSGANKPACLIGIARNTTEILLDNLTISNNNLVDFALSGINSPWKVSALSITGNSFYQVTTLGDLPNIAYCIYASNANNAGITITGNYIGGGAANCGGAAMSVTAVNSSYNLIGIKVSSYSSTATISSNTFQNITHTQSTSGASTAGIVCINASGSSNYTIGSSGNANTIGATTGTGSITLSGAVTSSFTGITFGGTSASNSIAYNTIGAVSISSTWGTFIGIEVTSTSTTTIDNNTIGSSETNNITNSADNYCRAIYMSSTGTYTVTNNTIQQFSLTGGNSSTNIYGIYLSTNGTLTATGNTIKDITSNGTSTCYGVHVNSTGTCIVSSNTIGSTTASNLSFSGNGPFYGIGFTAAGTFTCNSNTIQQLTQTGGSTNTIFRGISATSGAVTADGNIIKNIACTSTASSPNGTMGIYIASNSNQTITNNTFESISSTSSDTYCVYLSSTGTCSVSTNTVQNITQAGQFAMIYCTSASGNITINSNTIGSSTANNISLTGARTYYGIQVASTGTYTITNNTIQQWSISNVGSSSMMGIYVNGNSTTAISGNNIQNITLAGTSTSYVSYIASTGTCSFSSNTVGSSSANNIVISGNSSFNVVYMSTTGTYTCNNNTIQQIQMTGGASSTILICINLNTNGALTSTGNTFQNITSNGTGTNYIYRVNSTGTCTVSSNTIGSTTANNIAFSGNSNLYGIGFTATGTSFTCNNNTIQQFSITGGGASTLFYGISSSGGPITATGNTIQNITSNGTGIQRLMSITSTNSTISSNTIGSTTANNMTFSGNNYVYGILANGTSSVSSNTVQQFNLTAGGGSTAFLGIATTSGTLTATSNTIKNVTTNGTCTSCVHFTGIYMASNAAHSITSNTVQDCTTSSYFSGIYCNSTTAATISNNTIGSTTANNIVLSGDVDLFNGIALINGGHTCSGNTIQQISCTSTGTTSAFVGIYGSTGGNTISSNTIKNITSASKNTRVSGSNLALNGIYLVVTGGSTITGNTISDLTCSSTTAGSYSLCGIYSYCSSGTNTITKNKITNLCSAASSSSTVVAGIFMQLAGSVNAYNNVILLNNGASVANSVILSGIRNLASGTIVIYHNTVKIYGTATSLSGSTSAYHNGTANTVDLQNNIFQNIRTNSGATGKHYAIQYSTNPTTVTTENHNYLEASGTGGHTGYIGSDRTTLNNWQVNSGTGAVDYTASLNINSDGKSTNGTVSDIVNTGNNLFATVADDYEATARATPAPCRGAFECPVELPVELITFIGKKIGRNNELQWITASENDNDFFTVEKTIDGVYFENIKEIDGAGNSTQTLHYSIIDYSVQPIINYYRLKQTDYNGAFTFSELISIDNRNNTYKKITIMTNLLGQEIDDKYKGLVIIYYEDGSSEKVIH